MYKNRQKIRKYLSNLKEGEIVSVNDIARSTRVYRQGVLGHLIALKNDVVMLDFVIKQIGCNIVAIKVGKYNKGAVSFGASFIDIIKEEK